MQGVSPHGQDGNQVGLEGRHGRDDLGARLAHGGPCGDENRQVVPTPGHAKRFPKKGFAQGRGGQVGVAVDRLELAGSGFQLTAGLEGSHLLGEF